MNSHFCSQNKRRRSKTYREIRAAFILAAIISCISGCGRKKRYFLSFDSKQETEKINRLTLPAIKGASYRKKGSQLELFWNKPDLDEKNRTLIGYNVYKFTTTSFVPKKPINRTPLKTNFYREKPAFAKASTGRLDKQQHKDICFLVRGLFLIKGKTIEGPASQIVCVG